MGFFNDIKQSARWVGDKAKKAVKWVGSNKKAIKNIAGKIENAANVGAGMLLASGYGAPLAGAVAGVGRGAAFVKNNIDKSINFANKGLGYYDKGMKYANKIEDKIQKLKKK